MSDPSTDGIQQPHGPCTVPRIECNKCGAKHHPDAANGEYIGHCRECSAFLPRPTERQERQFTDFIVWKDRYVRARKERDRDE